MERKQVLIVDDDVDFLTALSSRLGNEGFYVVTATSAQQALQQAVERSPDVILLDINMPGGDGFNLHQSLRNVTGLSCPIIYITGRYSQRACRISSMLGAFGLIPKPFDTAELLATVREAAGVSREDVVAAHSQDT